MSPTPPTTRIDRVGVIGRGYVGSAVVSVLEDVADVRFHDPAVDGSAPLEVLARWADALFVCVPTPRGPDGRADTRTVMAVMAELARLETTAAILLKSTVPPGTCTAITARHPTLHLAFNPEFLRERHHLADARAPHRIVLGWSPRPPEAAPLRDLFARRFPDVPLVELSSGEAELMKVASNAFFGVKVSFANELRELAIQLGLDWEPVRQALVLDPRIGDAHLRVPGPDGAVGFGGACLPKDMAGLVQFAEDSGVDLEVVAAALRANTRRRPDSD